jgi:hypothetical protein
MMQQQICDKQGRSYTLAVLADEGQILFQLRDRTLLIGEARCVKETDHRLLLGDIAIANKAMLTPYHQTSFKRLVRYRPQAISYRRKGLGSALLSFIIDYVRAEGGQYLYGKVMRQDVENNPKLIQWYQSHGFDLQVPLPEDEEDILFWIYQNI